MFKQNLVKQTEGGAIKVFFPAASSINKFFEFWPLSQPTGGFESKHYQVESCVICKQIVMTFAIDPVQTK